MEPRERLIPIHLRNRERLPDRDALRRLITRCLDGESAPPGRGIGVVLVGDRSMRRLNQAYRGLDRSTDVLSFPTEEPPPLPEGVSEPESDLLGEIVVSVPRCLEQANDRGCDSGVEFVRLIIHGLLHILGHDHERRSDRAKMLPRERKYRDWAARQGIGRGLLHPPGGRAGR